MNDKFKEKFYRTLNLDTKSIKALKHFKKIKLLIHKDEVNQKSSED